MVVPDKAVPGGQVPVNKAQLFKVAASRRNYNFIVIVPATNLMPSAICVAMYINTTSLISFLD